MNTHTYIYIYVCVFIGCIVLVTNKSTTKQKTHTHIYICVCVFIGCIVLVTNKSTTKQKTYIYVCVYIYIYKTLNETVKGKTDIVPLMKAAGVVKKFWTLYIFYWIKVFLKLPFAVSFSILFITIQYVVFCKSFTTFYVSLNIYIYDVIIFNVIDYVYIYVYMHMHIYMRERPTFKIM